MTRCISTALMKPSPDVSKTEKAALSVSLVRALISVRNQCYKLGKIDVP
jgi:hypothetical protein